MTFQELNLIAYKEMGTVADSRDYSNYCWKDEDFQVI